jgi:hypothetical protein
MDVETGRRKIILSDEEDELLRVFKEVNRRRRNRDQYFLRSPKMNAMNLMEDGFREWILQETKDLLEMADVLRRANRGIIAEVNGHEVEIKCIKSTYMKRAISPMRKLEKHAGIPLHEEAEHCRRFRSAIDNAFTVILRLKEIRALLDALTVASFSVEAKKNEAKGYVV